jgi:Transposase domain (DUF772)
MSRRNFSQPSLADAFVKAYSRVGGFLEDIAKTFEWAAFDVLMGPFHSSSDGAPAYPPLTMFKIVLLQQWCGLSDPGAEEAVRDRLSFRRFCGIPLDQETPDHSSIWRFRIERTLKIGRDKAHTFVAALLRGQKTAPPQTSTIMRSALSEEPEERFCQEMFSAAPDIFRLWRLYLKRRPRIVRKHPCEYICWFAA